MDRIINATGITPESTFHDLFFILQSYIQYDITFADRAAENIHKPALHCFFLRSIICESSGPVEMIVTGRPTSSSTCWMKTFAVSVS